MDLLTEALGSCWHFDLRTEREYARDGGTEGLAARGWRCIRLPVQDEYVDHGESATKLARARPQCLAVASQIVERLLPGETTLVSCSLGKDRTGLVVALILRWLGVSEDAIARDYARSNACLVADRDLLPARWRNPKHAINFVDAADCLAAIDGTVLGSLHPDWRQHWIQPAS